MPNRRARSFVSCVVCGQIWDEDDHTSYVVIDDNPVCSGIGAAYDKKCKQEYIEEHFVEYIKQHNVLERVKKFASNPTLDTAIALKKELSEAAADETGQAADLNLVNEVISPLYDAEDLLKRGMTEYLPETLENLVESVEATITNTPVFSDKDKKWLSEFAIKGSKKNNGRK